jgi:hypothetical protein
VYIINFFITFMIRRPLLISLSGAMLTILLMAGFYVPSAAAFSHPNGVSSAAQLDAARANILAGRQPMLWGYQTLQTNAAVALNYTPNVPSSLVLGCFWDNPDLFKSIAQPIHDSAENSYAAAMMYYLNVNLSAAQRDEYGQKAIEILNAWANNSQTFANGCASPLPEVVGLYNAAELMLTSPLWDPADVARFKSWAHDTAYGFCRDGEAGGDVSLWPPLYNDDREWPSTTDQGIFGSECVLAIDHVTDDSARYADDLWRLEQMMDMQLFPSCANDACDTLPGQSSWNPPASLHYHSYWLIPMMRAAMNAKNNGTDLYTRVPLLTSGHKSGMLIDGLNYLWANKDNWPIPNQDHTFSNIRSGETSDFGPDVYWIAGNVYNNQIWKDWSSVVNDPWHATMYWIQMMIITPAPAGSSPTQTPTPTPTPTPSGGPCTQYTNTSQIPQGFGVPWDVTNPSIMLVSANCTPPMLLLKAGNPTTIKTLYVYSNSRRAREPSNHRTIPVAFS